MSSNKADLGTVFARTPNLLTTNYQLKVLHTYINSDMNNNELLGFLIVLFNFIMPNNLSTSINLVTAATKS